MPDIGVIGGSGLYEIDALRNVRREFISTPFGEPSAQVVIGDLEGRQVAFLPRHGPGHLISPGEVNYRANICALKEFGVRFIISVSAVGSLKEGIAPRHLVVPDQFIDRTRHRIDSFFADGIVAHVSLADPFCEGLRRVFVEAARKLGITVHDGGIYVNMEGPQFSTRAESRLYRSWGADIIGMTNLTEARLAREAEISYATLAFSTDYDCWHDEDVNAKLVLENFSHNLENARKLIKTIVPAIDTEADYPAHRALESAIVTRPEDVSAAVRERLRPIAGKYLG